MAKTKGKQSLQEQRAKSKYIIVHGLKDMSYMNTVFCKKKKHLKKELNNLNKHFYPNGDGYISVFKQQGNNT